MKRNKDLLYSAKVNNGMVTFYEYWFEKSRIELNNDLSGFKDNVETLDVIQFNNGIQTQHKKSNTDPYNLYKDDLVWYFNLLMDNQATLYTRKHYTLIDIFEEQGGLIKQVTLIALLLMKPFIFKRHDLTVFQDHVEKSDMKKFKYNEAKLERI